MSITRFLIVMLMTVLLAAPAFAVDPDEKPQTVEEKPQAVEAKPQTVDEAKPQTVEPQAKLITSVVQVLDRRSSINSILNHCTVELLFIGKPLEKVIGVDHIILTEALDDAGNDLIDKTRQPNRQLGQEDLLRSTSSQPANSAGMSINLKNPPRDAKAIKTLSGTAHFVLRAVEGKDFVRLGNFLDPTGKPITSDTLKDRGIELIYLPPQWIKDWATQSDDTKKRLIAAEELAGILPLIEGTANQAANMTLIPILVSDSKMQLAQIQINTPQGPLRRIQYEHITVFVNLTGPVTDPVLEVNLKSNETTLTRDFQINDIPLP